MKRILLSATIAGLLLAASPAFTAPSPDRGDRHGWQDRGHDRHHDRRHDRRQDRGHKHWKRNGHDNGRHLGWYKQKWHRGDRLSRIYLQQRYYVDDYRAYRLSAPPRGYRWVRPYGQSSDEFLLVQVATGLISQILGY